METQYLTIEQVAAVLQVCEVTVRRWIRSGKLLACRISPRVTRILKKDIDEFTLCKE